jgi:hypothetical protein
MSISRLPGDILLNVAYQLNDTESLLNIAQVCFNLCFVPDCLLSQGLETNANYDYQWSGL